MNKELATIHKVESSKASLVWPGIATAVSLGGGLLLSQWFIPLAFAFAPVALLTLTGLFKDTAYRLYSRHADNVYPQDWVRYSSLYENKIEEHRNEFLCNIKSSKVAVNFLRNKPTFFEISSKGTDDFGGRRVTGVQFKGLTASMVEVDDPSDFQLWEKAIENAFEID